MKKYRVYFVEPPMPPRWQKGPEFDTVDEALQWCDEHLNYQTGAEIWGPNLKLVCEYQKVGPTHAS